MMEWPDDTRNVMVTYIKTFYKGFYGDTHVKEMVTKKGFYSKSFDHIAVPPDWQYFNGILLPHGWGGDRLELKDVIKWEYCNE